MGWHLSPNTDGILIYCSVSVEFYVPVLFPHEMGSNINGSILNDIEE